MIKKKFFGTDGIRGASNQGIMTVETATSLGKAAGSLFKRGIHKHRVIIGKDTRLSGYMFEPALTAGFISVGMDVFLIGPMPTPAVAMLTKTMRADFGVMISASHNPYYDNGIKLFGPDGYKLSDEIELEIEKRMEESPNSNYLAKPENLGRAKRIDDAPGRYIEFVKSTFNKHQSLDKIKIVLDCANGAAYHLGAKIFWELGAEVIELGVNPDGFNINSNCGSNYPNLMAEAVKEHKADIGIALDGDADRVIFVDEQGNVINGDHILALIARYFKNKNLLKGNGIVATTMSNLAMERYLKSIGISLIRTNIGDRYVASAMRNYKYNLGGEQSGHIIIGNYSTTGDGLVTALQVLSIMIEEQQPLSNLTKIFEPLPQKIKNIKIENGLTVQTPRIEKIIKNAQEKLKDGGRILVRASGTEPLLRIMVEHENSTLLDQILQSFDEASFVS